MPLPLALIVLAAVLSGAAGIYFDWKESAQIARMESSQWYWQS